MPDLTRKPAQYSVKASKTSCHVYPKRQKEEKKYKERESESLKKQREAEEGKREDGYKQRDLR